MKREYYVIIFVILINLTIFNACADLVVIPETKAKTYAAAFTLTLPNTARDNYPQGLYLLRDDGALVATTVNKQNRFYFLNLKPGKYMPAYAVSEARGIRGNVRYVYVFSQMSALQAAVNIEQRNIYGGTIFVRASKYTAEEADPYQLSIMKKLTLFPQSPEFDEVSGSVYYYSITESTVDITGKERDDFMLFVRDDLSKEMFF